MKQKDKLYIVRKYIKAKNALDAIKKENDHAVDDVWLDEDWKKGCGEQFTNAVGFMTLPKNDD
jgi:hypothetical protein